MVNGDILVLQIFQMAHEAVTDAGILCSNTDKKSEQSESHFHRS